MTSSPPNATVIFLGKSPYKSWRSGSVNCFAVGEPAGGGVVVGLGDVIGLGTVIPGLIPPVLGGVVVTVASLFSGISWILFAEVINSSNSDLTASEYFLILSVEN